MEQRWNQNLEKQSQMNTFAAVETAGQMYSSLQRLLRDPINLKKTVLEFQCGWADEGTLFLFFLLVFPGYAQQRKCNLHSMTESHSHL